jgi:hypothetical protein
MSQGKQLRQATSASRLQPQATSAIDNFGNQIAAASTFGY